MMEGAVPIPTALAAAANGRSLDFVEVLLAGANDESLRKPQRTRLRLLASVAAELRSGVKMTDLKVSTVTANAGFAHGTFYRYFAHIRAATEALVEAFSRFMRDQLEQTKDGERGSWERERGATLVYTRMFRRNPELMRFMIDLGSENTSFARSFRRLNQEWTLRMAGIIAKRRAQRGAGMETAEELVPVAYALGGMIDEFLSHIYLRREPALRRLAADEETVADLLTELWCRGAYGNAR